jgi:hypothetical protein
MLSIQAFEHIPVNINNQTVYITIQTNSQVSTVQYHQHDAALIFNVEGDTNTEGYCQLTLPSVFDSEGLSVYLDDSPLPFQKIQNDTCTTLYFTYSHSAHTITIMETTQPNPSDQSFSCSGSIGTGLIPTELNQWIGPLGNPMILLGSACLSVLLLKRQIPGTSRVFRRKTFIGLALVVGIIIVLLGASYFSTMGGNSSSGNQIIAPNFALTNTEGTSFTLDEFRDKVVIIDFMSPMCLGCREQIPHHFLLVWQAGKHALTARSIFVHITRSLYNPLCRNGQNLT